VPFPARMIPASLSLPSLPACSTEPLEPPHRAPGLAGTAQGLFRRAENWLSRELARKRRTGSRRARNGPRARRGVGDSRVSTSPVCLVRSGGGFFLLVRPHKL
jgi:hypothetical protein